MKTFDVFISYARCDESIAVSVESKLNALGFKCWRDRENISPSEYFFPENLAEGIENSRVAIAILSKGYLSSYYCMQEFINCRLDQPMSRSKIRMLCLTESLAKHSIVEASGNKALRIDDLKGSKLRKWIDEFSVGDSCKEGFETLAERLDRHLSFPKVSSACVKYKNSLLLPLCEMEVVNTLLKRKDLIAAKSRLSNLSAAVEGSITVPKFLLAALRSRVAFLHYLSGEYNEALELWQDLYIKGASSRGLDDFGVLLDADMLIQCYNRLGHQDKAIELARESLLHANKKFGGNHEITLGLINAIAGIYCDSGRYAEALSYIKPAYMAIRDRSKKDDDLWRSASMNYAFVLMRVGEDEVSLPIILEVFDLYKNSCGIDNIDTAQAEIKLAECYLRLGRYAKADGHAQSAMRAFSQLDVIHPLRVFSAVIALQCAHASSNEIFFQRIHRSHISPLLLRNEGVAHKVRSFLNSHPEYRR